MNTRLFLIIMVLIAIPVGNTSAGSSTHYQVSEVLRIVNPESFECRLRNYEPATSVRFRVMLPETEGTHRPTKQQLAEKLMSAKKIELRNVRFRSYFRVEADIWIDGKPCWIRANRKIVKNKKPPAQPKEPEAFSHSYPQKHRAQMPVLPVRRMFSASRIVTIEILLETPVDCSILNDETPLEEALSLLIASVEPPLPLVIFWRDLEMNGLIDKDTPIGAAGMGRMKLRQALKIVLDSVTATGGGPELALVAEGGVVKLATRQMLYADKNTHVYDIADLLAAPSVQTLFNQGSGVGGLFHSGGHPGNPGR